MFYIVLYREYFQKSSETRRPGPLIFGTYLHLVDLCQDCLNYSLGADMFYIDLYRKKRKKNLHV